MSKHSILKMAYSPYLDRAALRGSVAVRQMADDMRIITANAGAVTSDDLQTLGWSAAQINTNAHNARELAYASAARRLTS